MHYLNKENIKIEKKHYSILIKFVQDWEESFWKEGKPEQEMISSSARVYIGILLFRYFNEIAAKTLDFLYRKELMSMNTDLMYGIQFATTEMKESAEIALSEKLEANPELLFEGAPLLKNRLKECSSTFYEMMDELLWRIHADRKLISEQLFGGEDFGKVIVVDGSTSDSHLGGRRTCIIITEKGRFLYKPKSMKLDVTMYNVVQDLFSDIVLLPKAVNCGNYGYAEFIKDEPAETDEDAKLFFEHTGGMCVLFQIFASTDFHAENLLVKGTLPAVVDVETIISVPCPVQNSIKSFFPNENEDSFQKDMVHSLFYSGILPHKIGDTEYSPLLCKDKNSILPIVNDKRVDVRSYYAYFEKGFRETYKRCIKNRAVLEKYLEELNDCQFRILLRNTDAYARCLQNIYCVKAMANESYIKEFVEKLEPLLAYSDSKEKKEAHENQAAEEVAALLRGDIPLFNGIVNSRDLYAGNCIIAKEFFNKSAKEIIQCRIDRLSQEDCEFELGLIKRSIEHAHILLNDEEVSKKIKKENKALSEGEIIVPSFYDEATNVFNALWEQRLSGVSGDAGWLDHRTDSNSFGYLNYGYSMGQSGIATFAAEYYSVYRDERAAQITNEFMNKLGRRVAGLKKTDEIVANYTELGMLEMSGAIRTLLLASKVFNNIEYEKTAIDMIGTLQKVDLSEVIQSDFYSGLSGCLYLLCTQPLLQKNPAYKDLVNKLCERILKLQTLENKYHIKTWDTLKKGYPISGLGHGVAGVGIALAAAWKLLGEDRLYQGMKDAFDLERVLYSPKLKTWPDFRDTSVADVAMNGYCSGAPGMGATYLKLHELGICEYDAELEKAIEKAIDIGLMKRDHYCCGNCASIEFLMNAGTQLKRPELTKIAHERLYKMVERKTRLGQYQFLPDQYVNFMMTQLMFGVSGVGHVLLKADNDELGGLLL